MSEMSTLCRVDTCAIMYSPYKSQLKVWPSPMGVQRVLSKLETNLEMEKISSYRGLGSASRVKASFSRLFLGGFVTTRACAGSHGLVT
ncbi:hypothetical protein J1N35_037216 [Gossypium stocksii]|uniref:Uncharacterized protein n=1 Tax=Gossypium stocksii TaxID=47602 RepID=A0A9D3UJL1_9ROSI|nr:hypothetical protein J1N35_037216 [Gossypium stocksii]